MFAAIRTGARGLAIAMLAATAAACATDERTDDTLGTADTLGALGTAPTTTRTADTMGMQAGAVDDAGIAGVLEAANQAEIRPSELAQERAQSAEVQQYAQRMITEHRMLGDSLRQIAQSENVTPRDNEISRQMQAQTDSVLQQLQGLQGAEFDRAYMQFMVESHQLTLDTLDDRLIPSAQSARMRAAMEQRVRPAVSEHLDQARQIVGNLGGAS